MNEHIQPQQQSRVTLQSLLDESVVAVNSPGSRPTHVQGNPHRTSVLEIQFERVESIYVWADIVDLPEGIEAFTVKVGSALDFQKAFNQQVGDWLPLFKVGTEQDISPKFNNIRMLTATWGVAQYTTGNLFGNNPLVFNLDVGLQGATDTRVVYSITDGFIMFLSSGSVLVVKASTELPGDIEVWHSR